MSKLNKLRVVDIENKKPGVSTQKMYDGGGLYLMIPPNGSKLWRFRYRFNGKENTISFGRYPSTSLKEARSKREADKKLLQEGLDPSKERKKAKFKRQQARDNTLEYVARAWHKAASKENNWSSKHSKIVLSHLETYIFPNLGNQSISSISRKNLLATIKSVGDKIVTMHRIAYYCRKIFRFAVINELLEYNIAQDIESSDLPQKPEVQHRPAITGDTSLLSKLLLDIDNEQRCHPITQAALKLLPLVALRPNELVGAKWSEFDFENSIWNIPAKRMKMTRSHSIPLSKQSLTIIQNIRHLTGSKIYVFPSVIDENKHLSDETVARWFRNRGYKDIQTPHGFRATFSSFMNEQGWNTDAIERQLAHVDQNRVRAAYHRSDYFEIRRKLLQAWADYLDGLKAGAK